MIQKRERQNKLKLLIGLSVAFGCSLCALEYGQPLRSAEYLGISMEQETWIEEDHVPITRRLPDPPPQQKISQTPPRIVQEPMIIAQAMSNEAKQELPEFNLEEFDVYVKPEKVEHPDIIVDFAEVMPTFPEGEKALYDHLSKVLRYPTIAKSNGIDGTVLIKFVVDRKGRIREESIEILRSPHESLSQEAKRVIMTMPRWNPGMQGGRNVSVPITLPIRFRIK